MGVTTIEWFGTTTFRVHTGGPVLFFDAYLDRIPGLDPVGLSTAQVGAADFVFVSHAHFDHLYGAEAIAKGTGATVVGSPEVARCLRAGGVPEAQLLIVTGGETVDCGGGVGVRVLPALHSCLFAHGEPDTAIPCLGDLGVSAQDRIAARQVFFDLASQLTGPAGESLQAMNAACSAHDGGQLSYLLHTGEGTALVSASAGYWSGIFTGLRPDVALLATGGRPNVDGEPYQGSGAQYLVDQVALLRPERVALCHHDPLFPGFPGVDIGAAVQALTVPGAPADYVAFEYATPRPLFG